MLLETIQSRLPRWMLRRAWWTGLMETLAATLDGLGELVQLGRLGALPGMVPPEADPSGAWDINVTSLALVGRDMRMAQGLSETPWDFAARLRAAPDTWPRGGTPHAILTQLQGALSAPGQDPVRLRLVTANGGITTWYTLESDGTFRVQRSDGVGYTFADDSITADATAAQAWDWDSTTVPPNGDQGQVGRWWVIVYPPASTPYLTADGGAPASCVVDCGWNDRFSGTYNGSPWAATCGTNAPIQLLELIRGVIEEWAECGLLCAYVIVSFDPDEFAPDGSGSAYPDGSWGHHSKYDAGTNARIPARLATAEYMPAQPGGRAP